MTELDVLRDVKGAPFIIPPSEQQQEINRVVSRAIQNQTLARSYGPGPYQVIYVDPPWKFSDANTNGNRGASCKYPTMTMGQLFALRPFIDSLAAPTCALAMWWVGAMGQEALDLVRVWGFERPKMDGFAWRKMTRHGKEAFGPGRSTRPGMESCLFAYRGRPKVASHSVRQLITAPKREHSRKPDEARNRLVELWGDVPRIELFARESSPGWDTWGNQAELFDEQKAAASV